jgi:hypothetical protein
VLKYLARYVSGVAISDRRLVSHADGRVTFRWKNYARGGTSETTPPLQGVEFVRRYLLHVLPCGFVRIRGYGLLSNRLRRTDLARCRALLAASPPGSPLAGSPLATASAAMPVAAPAAPAAAGASSRSAIADRSTCATCRRGRLVLRESWPRPTVWDLVARRSSPFRPRAGHSAAGSAVHHAASRPAMSRRIAAERSPAARVEDTS